MTSRMREPEPTLETEWRVDTGRARFVVTVSHEGRIVGGDPLALAFCKPFHGDATAAIRWFKDRGWKCSRVEP